MQVFSAFLPVPLRLTFLFKASHTWRQSKVLFSSCVFVPSLPGLVLGHLCCVPSLPVCVHLCVAVLALLLQRSGMVCVRVFLCVCIARVLGCMAAVHVPHLTFSLSLCFYASSPWFHPGFCVLHNCVLFSVPQLTCSDTLHCSSMTSAATGRGGKDENQDRRRVDENIIGIQGDRLGKKRWMGGSVEKQEIWNKTCFCWVRYEHRVERRRCGKRLGWWSGMQLVRLSYVLSLSQEGIYHLSFCFS